MLATARSVVAQPCAAGGVDDREVEHVVGGVEIHQQVEHLVDHFLRPGVGAVDLVDDQDGLQAALQRLLQHEPRLRHRAFEGVDQQQRAVGHAEHALDLAAEVGVAGRVDEVEAVQSRRRLAW